MNRIMEVIMQYWSQFILVFIGLGYLIRKIIDWNIKKTEIKYSSLQIERTNAIKEFYKTFILLQLDFNEYLLYSKLKKKDMVNEKIEQMNLNWSKFFMSFSLLKLFIDEKYKDTFENIYSTLQHLHNEIDCFYIEIETNDLTQEQINVKFNNIANEKIGKELYSVINEIEKIIRSNFGAKNIKKSVKK